MSGAEFAHLLDNDQMPLSESYEGLSPTREYAESYLSGGGTHLVEFSVNDAVDLEEMFEYVGTSQKIEKGVLSYGLGEKATHAQWVPKKGKEKADWEWATSSSAVDYFNQY